MAFVACKVCVCISCQVMAVAFDSLSLSLVGDSIFLYLNQIFYDPLGYVPMRDIQFQGILSTFISCIGDVETCGYCAVVNTAYECCRFHLERMLVIQYLGPRTL